MLTGNPMGPQKQQPSVYSNPFQSIMAGMDADAAATGAIGRTIQDGVRTMFGLPPRELTREEQFQDMIDGIEDLGSEEGFNQFLDAYAMVDPFAVEDIRRQRRLDELNMENTRSLIDSRENPVEDNFVMKPLSNELRNTYETLLEGELPKTKGGFLGFGKEVDDKMTEQILYEAELYRQTNNNISPKQALDFAIGKLSNVPSTSQPVSGDQFSSVDGVAESNPSSLALAPKVEKPLTNRQKAQQMRDSRTPVLEKEKEEDKINRQLSGTVRRNLRNK